MSQESHAGPGLSDAIFKRCVEDSSDAIMLTGVDGRLQYVNRSWTELYGYSCDEALGRKASLLHSGKHDQSFYERMWADILSSDKGSWSGEVTNRAKDGQLKTVILTITPYRSADGQGPVAGFMGLAVDQTAVVEMKNRLRQQDKLALLGTLAGALAHEIGSPLGVVRGRAEMLLEMLSATRSSQVLSKTLEKTPSLAERELRDPEARALEARGSGATGRESKPEERGLKCAQAILDQVDRITKVMERILGFARTQTGGAGSAPFMVEPRKSMQSLFDDVEALVDAHFRHAGVELEMASAVSGLSTTCAPAIEQILINVLVNAVRAVNQKNAKRNSSSDVDGEEAQRVAGASDACRVRVELLWPQRDLVRPSESAEPGTVTGLGCAHWVFVVEDSGAGVPEELREKIFEPFFTTDPLHGTGLGLAISSKIAHDMGGALLLGDEDRSQRRLRGARFELHVPAALIRSTDEGSF